MERSGNFYKAIQLGLIVMNEQQKIQYIAHTISPTILNSIITNVFSFFLNTCQRSTEYLSRAKGKKYRTSEASTGDFLPFALDKCGVRSYLCAGK